MFGSTEDFNVRAERWKHREDAQPANSAERRRRIIAASPPDRRIANLYIECRQMNADDPSHPNPYEVEHIRAMILGGTHTYDR